MVSYFQQVLFLIIISSSSLAQDSDDNCQPDTCKCGIHNVEKTEVTTPTPSNSPTPDQVNQFEYPYIAALMVDKIFRCSGTVISKHHVVTAAHCLDGVEASNMVVRVGVWDLSNDDETSKDYDISKFVVHEGYLPETYANDIALVVTTEGIQFSSEVGPVCLPFGYESKQPVDLDPADVTVLGWGVNTDPTQIGKLQKVTYSIVAFDKCNEGLNVTTLDPKLCLLDEETRSNVCMTDFGGPVLWQKDEKSSFHLIGVVSVASACGTTRAIFNTFVPLFLDWIKQHTTDFGTDFESSSLALNWNEYCQFDTCKCGIHHVGKSKITTSSKLGHVDRFEYPYIATLMVDKAYRCSGTVITKHHIVTAAHCLDNVEASNMVVRVGVWDLNNAHETSKDYEISKFVIHENYLPKTFSHDIALVVTTKDIRLSSGVGPVCLPFRYKSKQPGVLDPADVTVLGVVTSPTKIDKLKKATYSIASFEKCNRINVTTVDPKLCLLDDEARSNVCLMDHGGPVLWQKDERSSFQLIGIISVASTCRTPRPVFSTFVPLFLDWIKKHTTGDCLCENS